MVVRRLYGCTDRADQCSSLYRSVLPRRPVSRKGGSATKPHKLRCVIQKICLAGLFQRVFYVTPISQMLPLYSLHPSLPRTLISCAFSEEQNGSADAFRRRANNGHGLAQKPQALSSPLSGHPVDIGRERLELRVAADRVYGSPWWQ